VNIRTVRLILQPQTGCMKKLLIPVLTLLAILYLISCEEDFEMNAPYQDITVVYGLLDQGSDSIFIKINKAFLGEGNVLEMAKIEDSSIYVNGLQATIEEWQGENKMKTDTLETTMITNKDTGIFYNPYQVIYFTTYEPNQDLQYKLNILVNDKQVTASTYLVNNFSIKKPNAGSPFISFTPNTIGEVEWVSAKNGKRYEVVIRFKYKELWFDNPDTIDKYIDWTLPTTKSKDADGGEPMSISYLNNGFYTLLESRVPYSDASEEAQVSERFTNGVDFIFSVAAEELNTYMEVNEPSNSIVQEKPDYTNIYNGLGLFSSRFRNIRTKKVHPETIQNIKDLDDPYLKFVY
jgi:hypothetical protein